MRNALPFAYSEPNSMATGTTRDRQEYRMSLDTQNWKGYFATMPNWLLTSAWPASGEQIHGNLGIYENPLSRNFYVLAFKHPEFQRESVVVPNYTATGDKVCTYLSILFGKRFENHG